MDHYSITIADCNSIQNAEISIHKNTLNIKYGPNGLGKSTIARAISSAANKDGLLKNLKPFKYKSTPGEHEPSVTGVENIASALVFNEAYVSQFVFKKDEVVQGSFEIFIETEDYKLAMIEINNLFSGIKEFFDTNEDLKKAIVELSDLREAFTLNKDGSLSKSSKAAKALTVGGKVENVPEPFIGFTDYLKSDKPAEWLAWQAKGNPFSDLSDNCPYCSSDLGVTNKRNVARQVALEYDSKAVEHLCRLQSVINALGNYFEPKCHATLIELTRGNIVLAKDAPLFLSSLKEDVSKLLHKLLALRGLSYFTLKNIENFKTELESLQINLEFIPTLNSTLTSSIVNPINAELESLANIVDELNQKIEDQRKQIEETIVARKKGLNAFLETAGYKYRVRVEEENSTFKMKLIHEDFDEHIDSAADHLSYGERNAFALVLFMYDAYKRTPDIIILDDPVSSFDRTKKFAIMSTLFGEQPSLKGTTAVIFTHDIEPAIDLLCGVRSLFQDPKPVVSFLVTKSGAVSEQRINRKDIQTFAEICKKNIGSTNDEIIQCIYARRHFEILHEKGDEYEHLSSLLHARAQSSKHTHNGFIPLTPTEIADAEAEIRTLVLNFNYSAILKIIENKSDLQCRFQNAKSGYEKLQLFRIFHEHHLAEASKPIDSNLHKFMNESFHIENEYIMQLNPQKFDHVPEHIIAECARIMLMP